MELQGKFTNKVSKDLSRLNKQSQPMNPFPPNMTYQKPVYNPDNPYQDLMQQMYNKYNAPQQSQAMPSVQPTIQPIDDPNDDNDAQYKGAKIYDAGDEIVNAIPPYQQLEGSTKGLLGAGIRPEIHIDIDSHNNHKGKYKMGDGLARKRGRPLSASEVQRIQDKKMAQYSKKMRSREQTYSDDEYPELSRAPNPSLHQYLNMSKRKAKKEGEEDLRTILKYMKEMEGLETPRERRRNRGHNF
jgi:hypothetical protein